MGGRIKSNNKKKRFTAQCYLVWVRSDCILGPEMQWKRQGLGRSQDGLHRSASCTWTLEHLGCAGAAGTRDIPTRDKPQTGANSFKCPHLGNKRRSIWVQAHCLEGDWAFACNHSIANYGLFDIKWDFFSSKLNWQKFTKNASYTPKPQGT